ncbi:hypothetical protein, partial [Thiolapillus sp.]|uniref:hypothetical protein n=1 Tax=Thiolapillus sp. TaxID=2017437 RepID=UPI003AF8155C
ESPIPVAVSRCRPRLFLMPVFGAILAQVFGGIPLKTSRNLKLLFRAKHVSGKAMLLSCDWRLLRACEKHGVSHACFKMAMLSFHRDQCESILDNKEFGTDAMRVIGGKDPFFHFDNTRRCHHCDQNGKGLGKNKLPQIRC